ncbi:MAG: ornithine carbamoyltransferase [Planctomycetes bacterium]|nr:ornithine carbamoyltransferase [Planctomycetota bacterium]MCB9903650.1 ornithine carbamoyltransferase [Planctomycetota bacterium]
MTALATTSLPCKDFLSLDEFEAEHLELIFDVAAKLKAGRDEYTDLLRGKRLAMIFEKDSLRTRFTFDIGMTDMGGTAVFLDHRDARLGSRESVKDMARNLERWVDVIVARTYKQRAIEELAANCEIPVINGLSDHSHPCQALTDYFTLTEKFGDLKGKTLCYVGDGNNTCHSLMVAGTKLGVNVVVCTPEGYEPDPEVTAQCATWARQSGGSITVTPSVDEAVKGAHVIYTDVWASMGQEDEIEERAAIFNDYQVDEEMMELADPGAYFLHCLPAHRGAEVSAGVMDGPQSIVYDNAENRLHVQKAIMALLLGAWN